MIRLYKRLISTAASTTEMISVIALCICTAFAFINTVTRYALSMPLRFTEELCVVMLIYMVFMSLPKLEKDNEHLNMTALYNIFPKKVKTVLGVIRSIITISLLSWFTIVGVQVVNRNFEMDNRMQVMNIPYGFIYLVIPVAFALVVLVRLSNFTIRDNKANKICKEKVGEETCL